MAADVSSTMKRPVLRSVDVGGSNPSTLLNDHAESARAERWLDKHVRLPVDLSDPNTVLDGETRRALSTIFPGTTSVWETGNPRAYLLFQTLDLPSAPWPKTIGGLPFIVSAKNGVRRGFLFPAKLRGTARLSVLRDEQLPSNPRSFSEAHLRPMARKIAGYFSSEAPDIQVLEIMYAFTGCFFVFLSDTTDLPSNWHRLPGKIGNVPTMYCHISSIRPSTTSEMKAQRVVSPTPQGQVVDDTPYEILRPGVLICSQNVDANGNAATLTSSSGVFVKDRNGNTLMTAATRAMRTNGEVSLPAARPNPRRIGVSGGDIPGTDISLVELDAPVQFTNEPFQGSPDVPTKLTHFAWPEEIRAYDHCYMDTPYTGLLEGQVHALSMQVEGLDADQITYQWAYLGQDPATGNNAAPPESVCGSAIWNDKGAVIGFHRFYVESGEFAGLSAFTSASCLYQAGLRLVSSDEDM